MFDPFREVHGCRLGEEVECSQDLATQKNVDRRWSYCDDRQKPDRFFSSFMDNRKNFDSYLKCSTLRSPGKESALLRRASGIDHE